jgi:hypothetical protein
MQIKHEILQSVSETLTWVRDETHTSDVPPPLLSGLGTGIGSVRHPLPPHPTSINKKIKQEIKKIQSPVP